tara:strand:- start:134 stop:454 length:321 start_codon:yes stop_codon:yes gene_type:complete
MLISPMRAKKYFIRTPLYLNITSPHGKLLLAYQNLQFWVIYLHIFTSLNLTKLSLSVRRKKVAEKFKKAIMQKRSRSGSSIWLERRPVTAEVASSSLVRIAMIFKI